MSDTRNAIQLEQGDNVATLLRAVEARPWDAVARAGVVRETARQMGQS